MKKTPIGLKCRWAFFFDISYPFWYPENKGVGWAVPTILLNVNEIDPKNAFGIYF